MGFDIYIDNTTNVPESVYSMEAEQTENVTPNIKTSVIVRNEYFDNTNIAQCSQDSNFKETENIEKEIVNGTEEKHMSYGDDKNKSDEKTESFDIETLVEECFLEMQIVI